MNAVVIWNRLVQLIFPPKCIFCRNILEPEAEVHICRVCFAKVPWLTDCLIPVPAGSGSTGCDYAFGLCSYSGMVKQSLTRYKFHNKPGYYRTFAGMLSSRIGKVTNVRKFDIIVSVPLHKSRQAARGYNQAYLIARAFSRETGIPEGSHALVRDRCTDSQSHLGREARKENVSGAFKVIRPEMVKGKTVLLIDDILTTGNTVEECGKALKQAGAKLVAAAVIATGRKH